MSDQPLMDCAQIETLVTREVCEEPAGPVCETVKTFEVEEICAPNKVEIHTQKGIFTNKHKTRSHPSNNKKSSSILQLVRKLDILKI